VGPLRKESSVLIISANEMYGYMVMKYHYLIVILYTIRKCNIYSSVIFFSLIHYMSEKKITT
jgi:hypothetical protein